MNARKAALQLKAKVAERRGGSVKRRSRSWTVPLDNGRFQEWGQSWLEPENWRDRVVLWWRNRRR